ncbi:helix-turn-helix domain-containing protein [Rothia sp. P4278]|uniref:helix-turn-helix domain-containing protein n=1 Tax=Rothia sp. P4278 TaxID=3402658 RepID=UPI003AE1BFC7
MTEATIQEKWLQEYASRIADHIAQYRRYLGISAEELSKLTEEVGYKIPRSSIANIENHKKKTITSHELSIIAAALGVPPEGLIWDIFNPAETFSYTPTSRQLPGYLVFYEAIKNELTHARDSRLTKILKTISFINLVYSQALSQKYIARTYYSVVANNAARLGHETLAKNINDSIRLKEINAAAQLYSLTDRLETLEDLGVPPWGAQEHIFRTNMPDSNLYFLLSEYVAESEGEWQIDSPEATALIRQLGIQPEQKTELVSASTIPNEPAYHITEQDKVRFFPNYFGD